MGYFMARNLATRKPLKGETTPLMVWNRTTAKSEKLLQVLGPGHIQVARTVEEIANHCDIIFTNLSNDEVVSQVFEQITKVLVVCATRPLYRTVNLFWRA